MEGEDEYYLQSLSICSNTSLSLKKASQLLSGLGFKGYKQTK